MPEISLFYRIRVTMYYDEHNPPHFHAEYNGNKAIIEIDAARCIKGALPSRQLKLILVQCVLHQDELMQNWELSKDGKPMNRINHQFKSEVRVMFPKVVQVIPMENYSVYVYFEDGKIVCYDMSRMIEKEVFRPLRDINVFQDTCTVMNDILGMV